MRYPGDYQIKIMGLIASYRACIERTPLSCQREAGQDNTVRWKGKLSLCLLFLEVVEFLRYGLKVMVDWTVPYAPTSVI